MPVKRTTIQDVATAAGVGKVTASYVLNGFSKSARISDETAARVLEAAKELRYRPNAVARMLATKSSNCIGVVFQSGVYFTSWSAFTSEVMRGVCAASVEQEFDLMLHTRTVATPQSEVDALADGRVDGALILRDQNDAIGKELSARGLPVMHFFTRCDDPDLAWVDADNYHGGQLATKHLLELGHRRIAMIRGSAGSVASNARYNGFRDAMEQARLPIPPEFEFIVQDAETDQAKLRALFARADRPTALFCWSDDTAIASMTYLRELGFRVPEDVSVIGFDSLEPAMNSVPALTSVRQPVFTMAFEATRTLIEMIRSGSRTAAPKIFPLTLDVRGSTAPVPVSHKVVNS